MGMTGSAVWSGALPEHVTGVAGMLLLVSL